MKVIVGKGYRDFVTEVKRKMPGLDLFDTIDEIMIQGTM